MNIFGELLSTLGWDLRVRRMRWAMRIKQYATIAAVMASIGTAIGYAVATRGMSDEDEPVDTEEVG